MSDLVKAFIRGLGNKYPDGTEKLEIRIPLEFSSLLSITSNQNNQVSLIAGKNKYSTKLNSATNNEYLWISPKLLTPSGDTINITNLLHSLGIKKNDVLYLLANKSNLTINPIISRKQFIQAQGATCNNWNWSWSFVNHVEKVVIFGVWDQNSTSDFSLVLDESWRLSNKGRTQPAFKQSIEHIKLIEDKGYKLKTFPMIFAYANELEKELSPAKIEGFKTIITNKLLQRFGNKWFAVNELKTNYYPGEFDNLDRLYEGKLKQILVNKYERNPQARLECINHHGCFCAVCRFNFENIYGELGKSFIHVHHLKPLSEIGKEYEVDPINDLIPLCPNCHAMIHKTIPPLSILELKNIVEINK